jgi:hypothetical protein
MLPEVGKYIARLCDAAVVHDRANDNPPAEGVQVFLPCEVAEGEQAGRRITAIRTLISKDGTIQLNEWSRLQEIFGTYTLPTEMFAESESHGDKRFEIDVQDETYNGETRRKVKWINVVGGGGMKMPQPTDSRSFAAKYGSKFRALAGGIPVRKSVPPAPAKKATPPPPVQTGPTATMEEAWTALLENNAGISDEDAAKLWSDTIANKFPGKTNTDLTPHDWGKLKEVFSDRIPM